MPKLKCPTQEELQASIDGMWRNVEEEYVECHKQDAYWSLRRYESSQKQHADAKRRAKPILKWLKYHCQEKGMTYSVRSVHLIDHSKSPPEVAPCIVFDLWVPEAKEYRLQCNFYSPKTAEEIGFALEAALFSLEVLRQRVLSNKESRT